MQPTRLTFGLVACLWLADMPYVSAINVILEPLSATTHPQILDGTFTFNEEPPAFDPVSAGLLSILQEIESTYEDAFEDPQTIRITYWWDADMTFCCGQSIPALMREDGNGNLTHAIVRFNPTVPYYIDPTPAVDTEYAMDQRLYSFGPNAITPAQQAARFTGAVPAVFEAGYNGAVVGGGPADGGLRDLLTLAYQEVGHSLGMNAGFTGVTNGNNTGEVDDGDYDVAPNLVNGAVMAMLPRGGTPDPLDHLVGNDAVMANLTLGSERTRPSTADFFAIAASQGWTQIDLPRKDFLAGANWHTDGNWLGARRPLSNDEAYVRHGGTVTLGGIGNVERLTIDNSSVVQTSIHTLVADEVVLINTPGVGTPRLVIEQFGDLISERVTVGSGTRLEVAGTAEIDRLDIDAGGQLRGNGLIDMTDFLGVLTNDGSIVPSGGGTLTIESANNLGVDLDGIDDDGVVIVDQANLTIETLLTDAFNSSLTITAGRTATFDSGITIGAGGLARLVGSSSGGATITGGPLFLTPSGVISAEGLGVVANAAILLGDDSISEVTASTSELRLVGDTFLTGGRIVGMGLARQIGDLFVGADTEVEIATYDLDGVSGNTVATISPGATLLISSAAIETGSDNDFDGTLNVNNGTLDITSAWQLDGTLNLNGSAEGGGAHDEHDDGGSNEGGSAAAVLRGAGGFTLANGGHINVTGTGYVQTTALLDHGSLFVDGDAEFTGPTFMGVNADVEINNADDTLRLRGQTNLIGPSIVGSGRIIFEGNVNIAFFDTAIGCAETDLDGLLETTHILINQGLRFSIASTLIEPNPNDGFDGTITNRGEFSVLAGWRLDGEIEMEQIGATIPEVDGLGPFRIHTVGTYLSDGASRILAPLQVAGAIELSGGVTQVNNTASFELSADVDVASGAELELNGVTTIAGGAYDGPGTVQLNAATTVTSNTTMSVGRVDLDGAANNTHVTLAGAALTLNTDGVDVIDNIFSGQVDATGASARLEVNLSGAGDSWTVGPTGSVNLSNELFGPIRTMLDGSDVSVDGDLNVSGQVALGANVTMRGDLKTANVLTDVHFASGGQNYIDNSASVGGTGDMTVDAGTMLHLENGVLIGIDVENGGRLEVGYVAADLSTAGGATIRSDFDQTATGTFGVDVGGLLAGDQYDRLNIIGEANLSGAIDIQLINGFAPALGQLFTVVTAQNVVGQFTSVQQPLDLPLGLLFDVVYNPTNVQLVVVEGPIFSADFDVDGDVDGRDFLIWQRGGSPEPLSASDLADWQGNYGAGSLRAASVAVPEPSSRMLLALAAVGGKLARRRRIDLQASRTQ